MKAMLVCIVMCLVFAHGAVKGCEDLVEEFLLFRNSAMQLMATCRNDNAGMEEGLNTLLGFPVNSDNHWRSFLYDVARARDVTGLNVALQTHIAAASPGTIGCQGILATLFASSLLASEQLPGFLNKIEDFQSKLQPWLVKTNFLYNWPVVNTDRQEIMHLTGEDSETEMNLMAYHSELCLPPDFLECANALLQARSLDEYFTLLESYLYVDEDVLQWQHAMQDLFRNNEEFRVLTVTIDALLQLIERLEELGLQLC